MNTQFEKNKLLNYLSHLKDKFKKHEVMVGGGAITSLFNGKEINDFDIYFRSEQHLIDYIYDTFENSGDWVICHTKKATLVKSKDIKVQMIHFRYFETPEEIFESFDFTVCMGVYDFKTGEFVFHEDFMKHNAQRILKFNKNTAFPLISLLRAQKYKQKGYSIPKTEMLRIAMTCMKLEINSWDELKDQLGGMYGVSFEKLFADVKDQEFDMNIAIDKLANVEYDEDYFNMPEGFEFEDADDLIDNITKQEIKFFEINGRVYRIRNGALKKVSDVDECSLQFFDDTWDIGEKRNNWLKVDPVDYFNETKFYKFVRPKDGKLVSYFTSSFEYKVGEIVEERKGGNLFFNDWMHLENSTYADEKDKVLIEVEIKAEDFTRADTHVLARKCKVIRIVPEEEYAERLNS